MESPNSLPTKTTHLSRVRVEGKGEDEGEGNTVTPVVDDDDAREEQVVEGGVLRFEVEDVHVPG